VGRRCGRLAPRALARNRPDHAGRTPVDAHLRVPNHGNIFVIGDAAASSGWDGGSVPGLAPAAQQGGRYVARMIRARLEARGEPPPFVYRHRGSLATIGRKAAVADFGRIRLWGAPAWWLWGLGPRIVLSDHAKSGIGNHSLDLGLSDPPQRNPLNHRTRHVGGGHVSRRPLFVGYTFALLQLCNI